MDISLENREYFNRLKQSKKFNDTLKYFEIKHNYLIFSYTKSYILSLTNTKLSELDENVFLANPSEIFHFLQMNELLYKKELYEKELEYVKSFTNKYIEIKNNKNDGNEINDITLWVLDLIISKSYEDEFKENPAGQLIISLIDEVNKQLESGLSTGKKLVLVKEGNEVFEIEETVDNVKNFEHAGFTTLFLVITTVVLTCLFVAFFIFKH